MPYPKTIELKFNGTCKKHESWEKTDNLYIIRAPQLIWTQLKTKLDDIDFSNSWWNIDILYSSNLGRPLFVACLFNHRLFNIQICEVRQKKVQGMYFIIEPFVMSAVWPQIAVTSKILSYIIWSRKTAFSPGCLRCSFHWDQIDLLHVKPLYA